MRWGKGGLQLSLCCLLLLGAVLGAEYWGSLEKNKPKSLVTTFAGDPGTMRGFAWRSNGKGEEAAILQIAKGTEEPDWSGTEVATFSGTSIPVTDGNGILERSNKVIVTGLEPGTAYIYRAGNGNPGNWSEPAAFETEAEGLDEFTFIHVSDSQGETEADFSIWGDTAKAAFSMFPESAFVIHGGDLTEDPSDGKAWDYFFKEASPWVQQIPLMPTTGNHDEVDGDSEMYRSYFQLPDNGESNSARGSSYYFQYGNVRFIMLNTESRVKKQTEWLREVLSSGEAGWTVVSLHRGPYGGNVNEDIGDWVELFDEYKVDLVLQGHNHEYSRSYPLRHGEIVASGDEPVPAGAGTVYVVSNAAGQKLNDKKKDQFYHKVHMQNGKPVYADITVKADSLRYAAYDVDGQLLDSFEIVK
ncbi:purple acid phosphatase family protein [Paenibacillus sp. CAU 1782]